MLKNKVITILLVSLLVFSCLNSVHGEPMTQEKYEQDQKEMKEALGNMFKKIGKDAPQNESLVKPLLQVLYKDKQPSLDTLKKTKEVFEQFKNKYEIQYHNILEPESAGLIRKLQLNSTHFPFGILIDGKSQAKIDNETIIFHSFPDFMHHMDRHQGNWTLEHLKKVLKDNSLLIEQTFPPRNLQMPHKMPAPGKAPGKQ